jgi:hypothetical protein
MNTTWPICCAARMWTMPADVVGRRAVCLARSAGVSRETAGMAPTTLLGPTLFVESVVEQVETMAKYSGYIDRQRDEIDRAAHFEGMKLPPTWTTWRSRR